MKYLKTIRRIVLITIFGFIVSLVLPLSQSFGDSTQLTDIKELVKKTKMELKTQGKYQSSGALIYVVNADEDFKHARTELHYTGRGRGGYRPGSISRGNSKVVYEFDRQPAELRIIHPDFEEYRRSLVFKKGEVILLNITLKRLDESTYCTVKGKIILEDGASPDAISVNTHMGGRAGAQTDEMGAFILSQLRPGELSIYATKPGYTGLYKTINVLKGETAPCNLKGYRVRKAKVRWVYQPDGTKDFNNQNVMKGTALLCDNELDRVSFGEGCKQVSGKSDFLVLQNEDKLYIRNFDVGSDNLGILKTNVSFDTLHQAPQEGYSQSTYTLSRGDVFVFLCYDGKHYAKMEILEIIDKPSETKSDTDGELVACWGFDKAENKTVFDSSGNKFKGSLVGNADITDDPVRGKVLSLDGNGSYFDCTDNLTSVFNGLDSFTVSAWVYWAGGNQWQRIFDFGDGTMNYMMLTPRSWDNTLRFAITPMGGNTNEQILETGQLSTGKWEHVAVTINGRKGNLFVNGSLANSNNNMSLSPLNIRAVNNYLGKSQFDADPYFNGYLDDVRIYSDALSAEQISDLYKSELRGSGN